MSLPPLPPGFTLRRAHVDDAEVLSTLAARTFTDTFGHLYPRSDLEPFLAETYAIAAQRALLASPEHAVWLLEQGPAPVGYALAGPCTLPHPDVAADAGELKRLYVLHALHGQRLGQHLMRAALDWLLRAGPRTLWLGVWSENDRAQRFYARYGFAHAGEYQFHVGQSRDRELIFRRPAQAAQTHPL